MKATRASLFAAVISILTANLFAGVPKEITKPDDVAEYQRGAAAASSDLKKGITKYEIIGKIGPTDLKLKRIVKDAYKIDIVFHGCVVGPEWCFDRGYLDTVVEHLIKKYGFDPVRKTEEGLLKEEEHQVQ